MTTYRCVCPQCTAFIRSNVVETPADFELWHEECLAWLAEHECGNPHTPADGVEKPAVATQFQIE